MTARPRLHKNSQSGLRRTPGRNRALCRSAIPSLGRAVLDGKPFPASGPNAIIATRRPHNLNPLVILKLQKRRITAHDVVCVSCNSSFKELIIVGIAANCFCEAKRLDHLRSKYGNGWRKNIPGFENWRDSLRPKYID